MSHMCKSCEYSCTHVAFVEFLQVVVTIMTCFTPPRMRRVTFSGLQFAMMTNPVEFGVPLLVFASYCPLRFTLKFMMIELVIW